MDDVVKSIKAHLYDRVVSPLFGAFLISWAIWNYRIIFVLLSSEIIPYKFNYIDEYYSSMIYFLGLSISKFWAIGIAAPLLSALFYIYLYPFFALPVYKFSLGRQKRLADIKNEIEGNTLLTLEKSRKIIQDSKKMQIAYDEKLHQAEDEIDALKKIIAEQGTELSNFKTKQLDEPDVGDKDDALFTDSVMDQYILDGLASLPEGSEFWLRDIVDDDVWNNLGVSQQRRVEKQFKNDVITSKFPDVSLGGKDEGGIQSYVYQSFEKIKDDFKFIEVILDYCMKNSDQKLFQKDEIRDYANLHMMEIEFAFDKMLELGFVEYVASGSRTGYRLLPPAREYIVKNMLHR